MKTKELVELLKSDPNKSARSLLLEKKPNAEKLFDKHSKALAKLLTDVRKDFPDAEFYTASGGFNLLLGESHTVNFGMSTNDSVSNRQLLALNSCYLQVGDGDW